MTASSRRRSRRTTLTRTAVVSALAALACATPKTTFREDKAPYRFTIAFDPTQKPDATTHQQRRCTVEVDFKNCDRWLPVNHDHQPKDCVRVEAGHAVVFESSAGEFALQFDPFGATEIKSRDGKTPALTVLGPNLDGAKNVAVAKKVEGIKKPYTFWVKPDRCAHIDPQIITEW